MLHDFMFLATLDLGRLYDLFMLMKADADLVNCQGDFMQFLDFLLG